MKHIVISSALLIASTGTAFAAVGDYKEVSCSEDYFTANSCSACFEGGSVAVGQKISGLYDTWSNKNATEQIAYKDEQTFPEIVSVSPGTTFVSNPSDPALYWKYGTSVIWTDSATGSGKQEFMLEAGKNVKFMEADLGAAYTLETTDRNKGEVIGVAKFPLAYHNIDADGNEGKKETHVECVAYKAGTALAVTPTPKPEPTPEPKKMTNVKTGPESIILFALALLIAAGIIVVKNRRAA